MGKKRCQENSKFGLSLVESSCKGRNLVILQFEVWVFQTRFP